MDAMVPPGSRADPVPPLVSRRAGVQRTGAAETVIAARPRRRGISHARHEERRNILTCAAVVDVPAPDQELMFGAVKDTPTAGDCAVLAARRQLWLRLHVAATCATDSPWSP